MRLFYFGLAALATVLLATTPISAQQLDCMGCLNLGSGNQACVGPEDAESILYNNCYISGGFCQMSDPCDPTFEFSNFSSLSEMGAAGTFLPPSVALIKADGRACGETPIHAAKVSDGPPRKLEFTRRTKD